MTLDGAPWFVAADVAAVLGLKNISVTLRSKYIGDGERAKSDLGLGCGPMNLVSESGLYKLVMRSDKPQAKDFQNWVTREVLPSIRKTGAYVTGQPSLQENPQMDPLDLMLAQAAKLEARALETSKSVS